MTQYTRQDIVDLVEELINEVQYWNKGDKVESAKDRLMHAIDSLVEDLTNEANHGDIIETYHCLICP